MDSNSKFNIKNILEKLIERKNLSRKESFSVFKSILDNKFRRFNDIYFGSFFAAMQTKGPTIEEIVGIMDAILKYDRIPLKTNEKNLCGIVGSGRDYIKTINVSTAAALVASGLGVKVVKNGCRSESSVSGTTDVLEELGVNVNAKSKDMLKSLKKNNIGFFDAEPYFPRTFKYYVGKFPFINPLSFALSVASAVEFKNMVFGLSNPNTQFTANILKELDFKSALVVQGLDSSGKKSIDEISILGKTKISELKNNKVKTYFITPRDLGLKIGNQKEIAQHKTNEENALHLVKILLGKSNRSSIDIVAMNSGALLYIDGKSKNLKKATTETKRYILSGRAISQLKKLVISSKGNIKKLNKYIIRANEN
jgi:anthranilate phosphoribosyltransferase